MTAGRGLMITAQTAMSPLRPRNGCYEQSSRSSPVSQEEKSVLPEEVEHWPLMTLQGNWPGKLARETGQYRLQKYYEQDRCYEQDGEPYVDASAGFFIAKHVAQRVPRVKPCRVDDAQNRETGENL